MTDLFILIAALYLTIVGIIVLLFGLILKNIVTFVIKTVERYLRKRKD